MTTRSNMKLLLEQYTDPGEPTIVSDDEDSIGERENEDSAAVSAEAAGRNVVDDDGSVVERIEPAASSSSSSYTQPRKDLLGILEVSKFFCHDNQEHHDSEIECGVASGLTKLLRRSLFLYEQAREKKAGSNNFKTQGLEYIVSLSTSLTMVLHCSGPVLTDHIQGFEEDLIAALQTIALLFASTNDEDSILTQVLFTNTCRTVGLIHQHVFHRMESLVELLLQIINGDSTPNNIKMEAADTLCLLLESFSLQANTKVVELLEAHSSSLISVISTASVPVCGDQPDPTLRLYTLAAISEKIRLKVMKRRCAILGIVRHFRNANEDVRCKAYRFWHELVDHPEASDNYSSAMFLENTIAENLAEAATEESDADVQLLAVSLLRKTMSMQPFPSNLVMERVERLSFTAANEKIVTECGTIYCEGMQKEPFPSQEQISVVVDYTTSSFSAVRSKAFETLESLLTKSESITILLDETPLLEKFAAIVSHGSNEDCEAALNIVRQLSRSSRHHDHICKTSSSFLGSLINFVARGDITNRKAHFYGMEAILALLSNGETTLSFLPFRQLLPWLVSFLNRTTADDAFKEQVVAVIIRLSTAYLEQDD